MQRTGADYFLNRLFFLNVSLSHPTTPLRPQLDNPNFCSFDYLNKAKYVGSGTTKSGKSADHYHQNSGIIPGIAMAKYDYFMDPTTYEPLEMDLVLQPFGKVLGNFTSILEGFSTTTPDPSLFTVGNIKWCRQGDDNQCGNVNERLRMAAFGMG